MSQCDEYNHRSVNKNQQGLMAQSQRSAVKEVGEASQRRSWADLWDRAFWRDVIPKMCVDLKIHSARVVSFKFYSETLLRTVAQ